MMFYSLPASLCYVVNNISKGSIMNEQVLGELTTVIMLNIIYPITYELVNVK